MKNQRTVTPGSAHSISNSRLAPSSGWIIRRRNLDQVSAGQIQPTATTDNFQCLRNAQATDFGRAGATGVGRVDAVDVEAQVTRRVADGLAHLGHQRCQRLVPDLVRRHQGEPLLTWPVEIVGGVTAAAQPDLEHLVTVQQAFLDRAPEWCAVRDAFAEHLGVDVGMRIDVHQRHRAVTFSHRTQDRQRDGVVAPQGERDAASGQHLAVKVGDDRQRFFQRIGIDRHVAQIGHLQCVERCGAGGHVVGADQAGFSADLARTEACTGPVGGADVQRHADETGVQALGGGGDG